MHILPICISSDISNAEQLHMFSDHLISSADLTLVF